MELNFEVVGGVQSIICARDAGTSKLAYIMMEIQGYEYEGRSFIWFRCKKFKKICKSISNK